LSPFAVTVRSYSTPPVPPLAELRVMDMDRKGWEQSGKEREKREGREGRWKTKSPL